MVNMNPRKNTSALFAVPIEETEFLTKLRKYMSPRLSKMRCRGRGQPHSDNEDVRLEDATWCSVYFEDKQFEQVLARALDSELEVTRLLPRYAAAIQAYAEAEWNHADEICTQKEFYEGQISSKDSHIESLENDLAAAALDEQENERRWEIAASDHLRLQRKLLFNQNSTRVLSAVLFLTYCAIAAYTLLGR